MQVTTVEQTAPEGQRAWWLRTLLVLQAPRAVFAALRDESQEALEARQEPVLALVLLAGMAGVLLGFGHVLDDRAIDALGFAVIVFFAGGIYGGFFYWLGGWALSRGSRMLGGDGDAVLSRHVLAFAATPLALSLLALWPIRLALYGSDLFRSSGTDSGTAGQVLEWTTVAFAVWSVLLLVIGVRTVQRFAWWRAVAASVFAAALLAAVLAAWALLNGE
jgi:hypothetical protein